MDHDYWIYHSSKQDYLNDMNINNVTCENQSQDKYEYLSETQRMVFFAWHLLFYIIALVGNIAAIIVTIQRNHKCFQKTCIISMALSDLITATSICVMYFNLFLRSTIFWTLGRFMCRFGPCLPIFGICSSCIALVGIALDRYRSVVYAFKNTWNPSSCYCMMGISMVWIVSAGIAIPIYKFFDMGQFYVQNNDKNGPECIKIYFCLVFEKQYLKYYYCVLIFAVFFPLLCFFLFFYNKIAMLIWNHRKPVTSVHAKPSNLTSAVETSMTHLPTSDDYSKTATSDFNSKRPKKPKNSGSERKIRTFKVIIFLMLIFLLLRLPTWIYDAVKTTMIIDTSFMWIIKYVCSLLTILSCALNPLLYTFLHQTIDIGSRVCKSIRDFTCEVCCCCISNKEFEEFETQNPFTLGQFDKKSTSNNVKESPQQVKFEQPKPTQTKQKNEKIRF